MRVIFLTIFLCGFFLSYSQQLFPFNPKLSLDDVSITQWTADDGLTSNNITSVFQDSEGLIWITSFNGFMIYDSERFEIYDLNTLSILETDGFYTIAENKNGDIFLASQGSGIIIYSEGEFTQMDISEGEIPKSVRSILLTNDGVLYAGTNGNGIYRIHEGVSEKIGSEEIKNVTVECIAEDSNGNIWIGTEGDGLFRLGADKIDQFTTANGLFSNEVNDISVSLNNKIYFATNRGMQSIDPDSEEITSIDLLKGTYVNCFTIDRWGSIWIGGEEGLYRYNEELNKLDIIEQKRGIDLVRISSISFDKEENLWVSSNRSGLIRLKEGVVSNLTTPKISSDRVNICVEGPDGKVYIGTDQNKIDVCKNSECTSLKVETDLNGNGIRDIYIDEDGSIWLATYSGIIHKENTRETIYNTSTGMPANNFRIIEKDNEGNFWFGSRSGGLVKFKNGKILDVLNINNGLESNFILALSKNKKGKLLVGTHSGGMSIIDPETDSIKTYHLRNDDAGVLIFNIDPDDENPDNAFLTANIGPLYFDGSSIEQVELSKDRRSMTYFDIVLGSEQLWITTNIGVLQIDRQEWERYLIGDIKLLPYFILDENSGMNNKECTGATRSTRLSNGNIYFPTLGGVSILDQNVRNTSLAVPNIKIRHAIVDQISYNINSYFEIPPGALRFTFEFGLLSFSAPERNQYQYKLDGFDEEWSDITYSGSVEYTNLPPGEYQFLVKGSNDGKKWNDQAASISFKVQPFFYETLWFYILVAIAVSAIISGIYGWRISFINRQNLKLKKVNAELDRFVYSASHEMRSPLSSILGIVQVMKSENTQFDSSYLEIVEKSVKRMDNLIQDITDYSRNTRLELEVGEVHLTKIIEDILDDISYTENYKRTRNEIKDTTQSIFYSDPRRIKIILSNIITNAFKHHDPDNIEDPFVKIIIRDRNTGVELIVQDNGPGIEENHQKDVFKMFYRATVKTEGSGLGLYIVQETVAKLGGTVSLSSSPGKGTTFTFYLPRLEIDQAQ